MSVLRDFVMVEGGWGFELTVKLRGRQWGLWCCDLFGGRWLHATHDKHGTAVVHDRSGTPLLWWQLWRRLVVVNGTGRFFWVGPISVMYGADGEED